MGEISGWLNRRKVVRILEITPKRLADLVSIGELTPTRDLHGRQRFDPAQVNRVRRQIPRLEGAGRSRAARPSGPTCAAIFRAFEEGIAPRDLVTRFEVAPDVIARLRREYAELGRDLLVSPALLEELRELLDLHGEITARALVGAVAERLRRQYQSGRAAGLEEARQAQEQQRKDVSSGKRDDDDETQHTNGRRKEGPRGAAAR